MNEVVAYGDGVVSGGGASGPATGDPLGLEAVSIGVAALGDGDELAGTNWTPIPRVYNRNLIHDAWTENQKRRQSQAATPESPGQDWIEPPVDLDVLTSLLLENVDYFAVVDQFATDVAGMGWDLVDAEEGTGKPAAPEDGHIEPGDTADTEAARQRREARKFLENIAEDFNGKRISLVELCRCAIMDHEATGQGYFEVSRSFGTGAPSASEEGAGEVEPEVDAAADAAPGPAPAGRINGLFHVPSRVIRRRRPSDDGEPRGYVQLDDNGRQVTAFRDWRSDPNDPASRFTAAELRGLRAHHGRGDDDVDAPKNELVDFRRYHPTDAYYGVPQVIPALTAVYGQIFADARNLRWFINRSIPDWLIAIKADSATLRDPQKKSVIEKYMKALEEHMKHLVQGQDHRTLIVKLPRDTLEIEFEKLSTEPDFESFAGYQTRNRDMVVRAYRMLPHRIGIIETASLGTGTGETQEETYKRAQVDPRQLMLEDFFNQLLDEMGWTAVRFKFREIDVVDEAREMGLYSQAVTSKAMTLNEMRAWLSRIVKDQDFAPYTDDDQADIPLLLLELQVGGPLVLPPQFGPVEPVAPPVREPETPRTARVDPGFANIHRRLREGLGGKVRQHRQRVLAAGRRNGDPQTAAAASE